MQALANSALVVYNAEIAGLGALANEDKNILDGVIGDPTGWMAKLQKDSGKLARLQNVIKKVHKTRNRTMKLSGLGLNEQQIGERINKQGKTEKLIQDADGNQFIEESK